MEWCDEETKLLINFSSQNSFLFGVKLSDYHHRTKRAGSRSSAINNFDTINRHQFFVSDATDTKNWHKNLGSNLFIEFMAPIPGACVQGFTGHNSKAIFTKLYTHL